MNLLGRVRRAGILGLCTAGLLGGGCGALDVARRIDPTGELNTLYGDKSVNQLMIYVGNQWNDFNGDKFWDWNEVQQTQTPSRSRTIYVGAEHSKKGHTYPGWSVKLSNSRGRVVSEVSSQRGVRFRGFGVKYEAYRLSAGEYSADFFVDGQNGGRAYIGSAEFTVKD